MKTFLETFSVTKPKDEEIDWQEVYDHALPKVFHYFCYKVGDPCIAEELTAMTFEKAWRGRGNYRKALGEIEAWLLGIARNVAADHFQKKSREISLDEIPQPEVSSSFDDEVQHRLEFQTLLAMLSQFPDREQELIAMKYGAELTNREIARLTGLSESNVGTILYRVVEKLRTKWEKSHER